VDHVLAAPGCRELDRAGPVVVYDEREAGILASRGSRSTAGRAPGEVPKETAVPFYQKGDVRIRYEMVGSGFPLLVTPGGGLNSRVSNWPTAVFNAMEAFKNDFRCITMDQRNANGGESTGPIPASDPWGAFADDQLGLMDHLGVQKFLYMGYCIGGPFGLKLIERAPERVVAAVLCQPVGHRPENPDVMYNSGRDVWGPELRARRPEITVESIEAYLHNLYRLRPDFVYSVSREFVRSCQTPLLVMPDDTPAHPIRRPWTLPRSRRRRSQRYFLGESRRTCSRRRSTRCAPSCGRTSR
jgi:pimeloyl-ACP methyl ester carboxylesterase